MMRGLRLLAGLLMLPFCVGLTGTVGDLVRACDPAGGAAMSPPVLALAAGFLAWLLLYYTLPHPVRTYVLAHELTHALWAWLTGAEVSSLKVSRTGGSVTLSRSNILVTLAPYFFPLYTVLVVAGYYVLAAFVDVEPYLPWWMGAVGFTWGFHFTFTLGTLMQRQSDIRTYGHVFSYALIYLLNVAGICLWIVLVGPATLEALLDSVRVRALETADILRLGWAWAREAVCAQ